ncbi:DeoR/GlpR family DNA-binding transcription regulator [Bythopirellula polymerisocia]|uniref:Glucitol operon repressor n=1 Tax=Bythopirellula polymerisocia TaxID=2528003 RepID=A0A5C6D5S3_9BACT|nr:DeoR/GlpR family DNA-binding transcription regulator [Bythopirellula polymerisocia]TWU30249.1 Glucitol operon repressor [Bythopirellula polymerisocia]
MSKNNILPLPRERRLEILAELQQEGAVRVTALAERFRVAEETIRRDLDKLSEEGHLARTHGGALSVRSERFDLPAAVRKSSQAAEKRRIAQQALIHIEPHDVVALDASTTVLEMVCLMPDMPLTVITYSLDVVRLLVDRPQIKVISTGGELDPTSVCLVGPIAEETIRRFSINKLFCSAKGIDLERGYSEASTAHASIKKLLMQQADQVYLLADHSKFGVRSMTYSGKLDCANVVVTDDATDTRYLDALTKAGVETEVVSVRDRSH